MAFTVTPTSGSAPYLLEANVSNSVGINNVDYSAELLSSVLTGSCPTSGATPIPGAGIVLATSGQYTANTNTTVGSCRVFQLVIRNVATNAVVASQTVNVNNLT